MACPPAQSLSSGAAALGSVGSLQVSSPITIRGSKVAGRGASAGWPSGDTGMGLPSAGSAQANGAWPGPASQLAPSGWGRAPGLLGRNVTARGLDPGGVVQCSSWSPLRMVAAAASQDKSVETEEEMGKGTGPWGASPGHTKETQRSKAGLPLRSQMRDPLRVRGAQKMRWAYV